MKYNLIKWIKVVIITLTYLSIQTSCSDNAPSANDETLHKGHGNWYKVEFKFTEGHIHGHHEHDEHDHDHEGEEEFFHGLPKFGDYLKTVQIYSFSNPNKPNKGIQVDTKEPIRLVKGRAYGLEVTYYDKFGKVMNHEFTTKEMAKIHQHFFIPRTIKSMKEGIVSGIAENLIHYEYRDTDPWNGVFGSSGVKLRGEKDPIGLKGFFEVEKAYQEFSLNIVLVHVIAGSKLDDDGNPYPFYKPSLRVMGTQDLNLHVPIRIFTTYPVNDKDTATYISEIAKEFNVSEEVVRKEIEARKKLDVESGSCKL